MIKTKYTNFKDMSDDELFDSLTQLSGIVDRNFMTDLNAINEFVLSKDGPFQCKFAHNVYNVIEHHDHCEVEAILATAKLRVIALLQTLE